MSPAYHKEATHRHIEAAALILKALHKHFDSDYIFQKEAAYRLGGKNRQVDILMMHRLTHRKIFIEVKTQKAEGNAHERSYLWFCPGVLRDLRKEGGWDYQNPKETPYQYVHRPFLVLYTGLCLTAEAFRDEIEGHFGDCVENYILLNLENPRFEHVLHDHIHKYFEGPLSRGSVRSEPVELPQLF